MFKVQDSQGNDLEGADLAINGEPAVPTNPEGEYEYPEALPCATELTFVASKDGFLSTEGVYFVPKTMEPEVLITIVLDKVNHFKVSKYF